MKNQNDFDVQCAPYACICVGVFACVNERERGDFKIWKRKNIQCVCLHVWVKGSSGFASWYSYHLLTNVYNEKHLCFCLFAAWVALRVCARTDDSKQINGLWNSALHWDTMWTMLSKLVRFWNAEYIQFLVLVIVIYKHICWVFFPCVILAVIVYSWMSKVLH